METLVDLLRDTSRRWTDRVALSMRSGLREDAWSYDRLQIAAGAIAHHLRSDCRLEPNDRIVVWSPNCPQLVATYFGAFLARVILVPIDPFATAATIERIVEWTAPAAFITAFEPPAGLTVPVIRLSDLPFDGASGPIADVPQPDDIAEIVFTSGTTGAPKGVILTHANIVANVKAARTILPPHPHYRLLSILPLSHMLEQTAGLYVPMLYGATIYYPTSRQPPTLLGVMRRHGIVTMVVVPQVLSLFLQGIEREVVRRGKSRQWRAAHRIAEALPIRLRRALFRDVHRQLGGSLAFVICGGAHLPVELIATWERLGISVLEGYGTTECSPIISTNSLWSAGSRSLGPPLPGVEVRIAERDEIQVRGASVSPGYWHDAATTRAAFTEDGWYRTGDAGDLDAAGHLHIRARLKDIIVLPSGLNVYPEDIERELLAEAAIADCVVLGMSDEEENQHVHAVIIPAPADDESFDDRIHNAIQGANLRLAPQQRVMGFSIWERGDFPRTNLQKVKRHDVLAALRGQALPSAELPRPADTGIDRFQELLASVAGVPATVIKPESDLALDLNLDSLSQVELAVVLEAELGVSLEDGDLASIRTVAELVELIERGQPAAPAIEMPRWARKTPVRIGREMIQQLCVFAPHRLVCRPFQVSGREHLTGQSEAVLLIANHSSHLDTPSILRALPARMRRRTAVAAAADYFYQSRPVGFAMSLLLNTFPFSREGAVRASLEYCGELADDGWSILVYPEGTRSPDGSLQPFRSGIGLLATELQLPIVPVAISGSHTILPKGRNWPRRGPLSVTFGCPVAIKPNDDRAGITKRLEDAVATLLREQKPTQKPTLIATSGTIEATTDL